MKADSSPGHKSPPPKGDSDDACRLPSEKTRQPAGPEAADVKPIAQKTGKLRNALEKAKYYWALSRL